MKTYELEKVYGGNIIVRDYDSQDDLFYSGPDFDGFKDIPEEYRHKKVELVHGELTENLVPYVVISIGMVE